MNRKLVLGIVLGVIGGLLIANGEVSKLLSLQWIIPYGMFLWVVRSYHPVLTTVESCFTIADLWETMKAGLIMKAVLVGVLGGMLYRHTRDNLLAGFIVGCLVVLGILLIMFGQTTYWGLM